MHISAHILAAVFDSVARSLAEELLVEEGSSDSLEEERLEEPGTLDTCFDRRSILRPVLVAPLSLSCAYVISNLLTVAQRASNVKKCYGESRKARPIRDRWKQQ